MILCADHPHDHVMIAISRGGKRRATTPGAPVDIPACGDVRWVGRRNSERREDRVTVVVGTERDIGVLISSISSGSLENGTAGNLS